MDKTGRINLRIDPQIKKECEAIAKESGVSLSSLISVYLASLARHGKIPLIALTKARHEEMDKPVLSFSEIYQTVNDVLSSFPSEKVKKAYLFGSYARLEANNDSDVDILLEPGDQFSLFDLGKINGELTERLKCSVNTISSWQSLDPATAEKAMKEKRIIYECQDQ
jgi:uncharacterized protein